MRILTTGREKWNYEYENWKDSRRAKYSSKKKKNFDVNTNFKIRQHHPDFYSLDLDNFVLANSHHHPPATLFAEMRERKLFK